MALNLKNPRARVFLPNGALPPVSHLAVVAHQDDAEFCAAHGIRECFYSPDKNFGVVVCTDGRGCSRSGPYAGCSDEVMMEIREIEQEKAAMLGSYACSIQLRYSSKDLGTDRRSELEDDLREILALLKPSVVYTHNPFDKHDSHVGVLRCLLRALEDSPTDQRPQRVLGVEAWRDLDWIRDEEKVRLDLTGFESLWMALAGVFDSQITGGKRYDLAALGRARSNATFFEPREADEASLVWNAIDLTQVAAEGEKALHAFVARQLGHLKEDVERRISKFS